MTVVNQRFERASKLIAQLPGIDLSEQDQLEEIAELEEMLAKKK